MCPETKLIIAYFLPPSFRLSREGGRVYTCTYVRGNELLSQQQDKHRGSKRKKESRLSKECLRIRSCAIAIVVVPHSHTNKQTNKRRCLLLLLPGISSSSFPECVCLCVTCVCRHSPQQQQPLFFAPSLPFRCRFRNWLLAAASRSLFLPFVCAGPSTVLALIRPYLRRERGKKRGARNWLL